MSMVLFAVGIWMGFCTFVAYCCVRVGSMRDDDYDDLCSSAEEPASGNDG